VTLGALEPKFWAAWCHGVGREDLLGSAFEPPGSEAHVAVQGVFMERTRAEWEAFAGQVDCCLEPVLDLDEALDSELVRARGMVVELEQPGVDPAAPVRLLGTPIGFSRTPGDATRGPGPVLGADTAAVLRDLGYGDAEVERMLAAGAVAGPASAGDAPGAFLA
jgi:crotonobetainyl-CoA:carnitine CoA-transferase CaiB-like acyl-CoA transferase